MNGKHFEIGTIQAFLDGETAPDVSVRLTDHIASCDSCATLLAIAEEENSLVFSALERELNTLVPTQRLWSRINESITVEQHNISVWDKIFAVIRSSLANPSIAAAAGIILVAGMFAILWMPNTDQPPIALNEKLGAPAPAPLGGVTTPGDLVPTTGPIVASVNENPDSGTQHLKESNLSPEKIGKIIKAVDRRPVELPTAEYAADAYLPGEESYVQTIADLKENVDSQKDTVLTPSTRVSFERDLAVVNDSITRMREVVRKNPRNQAARQILYSSYQDKIDLLNSVAQREELIASLR